MAVIGSIIDNKYEILKLIGRGGMSEVYLAMDVNLNKQWAVKEIKKENTPESVWISNESTKNELVAGRSFLRRAMTLIIS